MKRRSTLGVLCACLVGVLDFLAIFFVFRVAGSPVEYVFLAPCLLGEQFLLFARETWGWPIASGFMTSLSEGWSLFLLFFNVFCYAALGFFIGSKLGGRIWKAR
ncbi:hypothetical protein F0U62_03015 [Cystobacter fuscus]|uniref:hypothetical protein n=1 Tax=Cystobacter fuscus TaxID=43 RepID=UPI002B2A37ED|nr:hypothetical protein F0U62_03015 [Cystobacter fuscus]